jgi:hypothetical protein
VTSLALSAAEARRFLVRRQLLDPPRALPASPSSVLAVVERLGSLQFDPLEVPGARSHDLVLHARIAGFERVHCDALLYGAPAERRLFEAYNKSLNILPLHELPYYRLAWERAHARYESTILAERSETVRTVLDRLKKEGPLSTAAFKDLGPHVAWHWAPTAEGRAVLEALFETGQVGISRRDGSRRTFDLVERLFPAPLLKKRVSPEASARHRLLSRYRGVGLMGRSAASELTHGTGSAAERATLLDALVDEGVLVAAEIEGERGPRYLLREELPLLDAPHTDAPGVTFLGPLDPLLWDRRLLRSLFAFDYLWEVYTPEAKRVHGYYVVPILFGARFAGRIEPRFDRRTKALTLVGLWFEAGFDPLAERGFVEAFAAALGDYQRFVGASKVSFPRSRVGRALGQAVRALG